MWANVCLLLLPHCALVLALVDLCSRGTLYRHSSQACRCLQVLVQPGASALFTLLRKTFQAALNGSACTPGAVQPLVSASWDVLCRIIHEGGTRATSMTVRQRCRLVRPQQRPDTSGAASCT